MQLKHIESLTQPAQGIVKVTAVCWAPNGKRLAICTTDRVVIMFDENGVRKDKFSTKPADKVTFYINSYEDGCQTTVNYFCGGHFVINSCLLV